MGCGDGARPHLGEGSEEDARPPLQKIFLLFDLKMSAVCCVKLDLTEETRTQLQEEEAMSPLAYADAAPIACMQLQKRCAVLTNL